MAQTASHQPQGLLLGDRWPPTTFTWPQLCLQRGRSGRHAERGPRRGAAAIAGTRRGAGPRSARLRLAPHEETAQIGRLPGRHKLPSYRDRQERLQVGMNHKTLERVAGLLRYRCVTPGSRAGTGAAFCQRRAYRRILERSGSVSSRQKSTSR